MPEGDTIHKLANAMRPLLEGQELTRLELRDQLVGDAVIGATIGPVEALGKHLLIGLGDEWVLRTHLGMSGSWHHYRPGASWQRPKHTAKVVLATADHVFVCFRPPQAELFHRSVLADHPVLSKLGPDLLAPDFNLERALERARHPDSRRRPIGDLLLDQRVACGIGNVYKSEALFIRSIDPFRPVEDVVDDDLAALYRLARKLMQKNLGRGKRVTTFVAPQHARPRSAHSRTWVYRRASQPCLVCGDRIKTGRQGDLNRSTYWCPTCQPE